jgi:hypothetical protein
VIGRLGATLSCVSSFLVVFGLPRLEERRAVRSFGFERSDEWPAGLLADDAAGSSSSSESWMVYLTRLPSGVRERNRGPFGGHMQEFGLARMNALPAALRCGWSLCWSGKSLA